MSNLADSQSARDAKSKAPTNPITEATLCGILTTLQEASQHLGDYGKEAEVELAKHNIKALLADLLNVAGRQQLPVKTDSYDHFGKKMMAIPGSVFIELCQEVAEL